MILTITLNPSIDISVQIKNLVPEDKLRCDRYEKEVGGGGINVAKGLHRLGLPVQALFIAGGKNGRWIQHKLAEEELKTIAIPTKEECRENISILVESDKSEYRLVNKGHVLTAATIQDIWLKLKSLRSVPTHIVISGSTPPFFNARFFEILAKWCKQKKVKLVLDMPPDLLRICLKYTPYLIKPNQKEFCELVKKNSLNESEIIPLGQQMIQQGKATYIAVSLGSHGGILLDGTKTSRLSAPKTKVLSTVGAGDSMVAGLLHQLIKKTTLEDSLRLGLACGSAATVQKGTKLFDPATAWKLYHKIK